MSLRAKLIWSILVFIAAIFIISKGYASYTAYHSSKDELVEQTNTFINERVHSIKDALTTKNKQKAQTILTDFYKKQNVSQITLYDKDGQPFITLEEDDNSKSATDQNVINRLQVLSSTLSTKFLYVLEPIIYEKQVLGLIKVSLPHHSVIEAQVILPQDRETLALLLIAFLAIIYLLIEQLALKPVIELKNAIEQTLHGQGGYVQIRHHAKDEIGDIANAFNQMMNKLRTHEKQRQHSLDIVAKKSAFSEEIIESLQQALVITDNNGNIIYCNAATFRIFDKTPEELEHANFRDLINTQTSNELSQILSLNLECDDVHLQYDDREQQLSLSRRHLTTYGYSLFSIQDITEIEEAMNKQRVAGRVFESSQDGLVVLNHRGIITMVNPAVTKMIGLEEEQLVGKSFIQTIKWHKLQKMMPSILESIENYGIWQGEVVEQDVHGNLVPIFARVNRSVKCEDNGFYDLVIVLTDLSGVKEMERLEYLAHHDALTGLANRAKFNLKLEALIQRSGYFRDEFAVLYLDLDGFKQVNDTYGHDAGDEVLKKVAARLAEATRHSDLIARLSGDEFAMLVNPANQKIVTRIADKLLDSVCSPIEYKGNVLQVGVSIGVKLVGVNEHDATRILKSADTAMYQAKKAGKGQAILMGCE